MEAAWQISVSGCQQLPSLERVAPKYSKLLTLSSCTPFIQISDLPLPLIKTFLFSVLVSIPYASFLFHSVCEVLQSVVSAC